MSTTGLISICIPTFKRPAFLREALESCLAQTYESIEIVVGDDSPDDASQRVVDDVVRTNASRMTISYVRNTPSLGQSANVNALFARAKGDRLMLLHDDDALLPSAVEQLSRCFDIAPHLDAAFGKQYIVNHDGSRRPGSDAANATYNRTTANSGLQAVPAIAGVLRMFPNDGYLVRTSLARAIGYRSEAVVGPACDVDFGLRFCLAAQNIWYLDEFVMAYRLSNDSITNTAIAQPFAYDIVDGAQVPPAAAGARRKALADLAPGAASGFAQLGQPRRALGIFFSANYSWKKKLRARGVYHALMIAAAYVRTLRRSTVRH